MTRPDLAAARAEAAEALALVDSPASDAYALRQMGYALRSLLAATANYPGIPESSTAPEGCGICLPGLCTCPSFATAPAPEAPPASEVREAEEKVRKAWQEWECNCEPAYCDHMSPLIREVRRLLAALDRGGAR